MRSNSTSGETPSIPPVAWFSSYPTQYSEISSAFDPVGPQPYRVPDGQWVTLGFMHDGFGTMELSANGQVVARRTGMYAPVNAPGGAGLSIGNALRTGGAFCNGEIDDVKIWRLNPRRFDDEFYSRPMDQETADCWKRFRREIDDTFRRHPDCAKQIGSAVKNAIEGLMRKAAAKGPGTQKRLEDFAEDYNRIWRTGAIDSPEMVTLFVDLIAWLRITGIEPDLSQAFGPLGDSECLKIILAELTPPNCDPQMAALLREVADNLDHRRRTRVTTA